jgi:serine/threonine-protein kinase Chk1
MLTERCGSLPYVAPEVCLYNNLVIYLNPDPRIQLNTDKPYAAEPIDAWGVGVILFTMIVGSA